MEPALSSKIEAASQLIAPNVPDGSPEQANQRNLHWKRVMCEAVGHWRVM